jgi:hypothetical protein
MRKGGIDRADGQLLLARFLDEPLTELGDSEQADAGRRDHPQQPGADGDKYPGVHHPILAQPALRLRKARLNRPVAIIARYGMVIATGRLLMPPVDTVLSWLSCCWWKTTRRSASP